MDPVVTLSWFVCPTVSMVTISSAAGLEKVIGALVYVLSPSFYVVITTT